MQLFPYSSADPTRSVSDGLILAVGRIALHECMYGNRDEANVIHRPAQRRMIDLRGGMTNLNFPDLVKRLMRWSDRVMSLQGNTPRLLPDDELERNRVGESVDDAARVYKGREPSRVSSSSFARQRSRRYEDEHVLIINNLSRFSQPAELDLSHYNGWTPVEMFGETRFPPIGDLPYFITLVSSV